MSKRVGLPGEPSEKLKRRWGAYGLPHLPLRLLLLAKMLDRTTSSSIQRNTGLTLAEWRVMANLARLGESTVSALADYSLVDPAEVSRAVRKMETRDLVTKTAHPTNRAKKLLALTEQGRALAERTSLDRRAYYAFLMEELDEEQRRLFDDLLLHLAVRVEQFDARAAVSPRRARKAEAQAAA